MMTKCSNSSCKHSKGFIENPNAFVHLPLRTQLENILSQHPSSYFENRLQNICDYSSDICRGDLCQYVAKQEEKSFITLIINVDGIEIAKSSKSSLWIITFVVNEFKKHERFQLQNVLVGGIGGVKSKPTRKEMAMYLDPVIDELLFLEHGHHFQTNDGNRLFLKVFLIGGSFDKPAQAIVQNIVESNGAYGCGKCLIKGMINNKRNRRTLNYITNKGENF